MTMYKMITLYHILGDIESNDRIEEIDLTLEEYNRELKLITDLSAAAYSKPLMTYIMRTKNSVITDKELTYIASLRNKIIVKHRVRKIECI